MDRIGLAQDRNQCRDIVIIDNGYCDNETLGFIKCWEVLE
jgi:hypothetical protein